MKKTAAAIALSLPLIGAAAPSSGPVAIADRDVAARCSVAALTAGLPAGVRLTRASVTPSGPAPAIGGTPNGSAADNGSIIGRHCLLQGKFEERRGAKGKPYAIGFELRVPTDWNGRLLYQGGGGLNGVVSPALGNNISNGSNAKLALARGFAVISTDSGHEGTDASFAEDQQAKINYAYAAIGKVTTLAKQLLVQVAGTLPGRTYFAGCSNGGREAMIAAERHPDMFDGVVAGDPAFHLSAATVLANYSQRAYGRVAPLGEDGKPLLAATLSDGDVALLSKSVLAKCDALDGAKDGMIFNHAACRYDPVVLQCHAGQTSACLPAAKVNAIRVAFRGPRSARGAAIASSWVYDAGVSGRNWREWQTGTIEPNGKVNAMLPTLITDTLQRYFSYPAITRDAVMTSDPAATLAAIAPSAAMTDATSTQMSSFQAHGGKMLIVTGWSDPIFSARDLTDWYETLDRDHRAAGEGPAAAFARLFMVPGMNHCGGGPALDDFDALSALVDWVEKDRAPDSIPASGKRFPGISRPLCAYPKKAVYRGNGAMAVSTSFSCA